MSVGHTMDGHTRMYKENTAILPGPAAPPTVGVTFQPCRLIGQLHVSRFELTFSARTWSEGVLLPYTEKTLVLQAEANC